MLHSLSFGTHKQVSERGQSAIMCSWSEEVLVLTSLPRSHVHDIAEISTAFSSDGTMIYGY